MKPKADHNNKTLVLVVDDDMAARMLMSESLSQSGFDVVEAADGIQAIEVFKQAQPAIVLMDVEMPRMDGFTACAELRKLSNGKFTPILMVTGLEDTDSVNHTYEVGATDFISKPINWALLGHRVRYILRASRSFNELRKSEAELAEAQRIASLGNWDWDIQRNQLQWSAEVYRIYGLQPQKRGISYEAFLERIHPDDRERVLSSLDAVIKGEHACNIEHRIVCPDGTERIVHIQAEVTFTDSGKPMRMAGTIQDITERKLVEQREGRLGRILNSSQNEIYVFDGQTLNFIEVNECARQNLGYTIDELRQMTPLDIKPTFTAEQFANLIEPLLDGQQSHIIFDTDHQRKDGTIYPVEIRLQFSQTETPPVFFAIIQDITERKQSEEQIRRLAYYDSLTNLPNRRLFMERLEQGLRYARRNGKIVAALYIDLDRFKQINDTLGHTVGDALLKGVAERLELCGRSSDSVARATEGPSGVGLSRIGGDEFTVLLTDIAQAEDAAIVARRIMDKLAQPFTAEGHEFFVTSSIGISIYPIDGDDVETILKNADTAMYHAKQAGRNNYQYYTKSMNARSLERLNMENCLRKAIEQKQLMLYYQPKVDIRTWQVIGAEALLRWQHPELGMVSPADFIPLAEETGLIVPIGEWVLRTACEQNKAWQRNGLDPICVSVNLSSRQFRQEDLQDTIRQTLQETALEPCFLELELTESIIMHDAQETVSALNGLKEMGLTLSVDDFGTGYSSLSYLKRFPLDTLKIDRSFIQDIENSTDNSAITMAIIAMAHSLNLKVVAEGVETEQQLTFLQEQGCDEVQGYLLGRPMPAVEFTDYIQDYEKHLTSRRCAR